MKKTFPWLFTLVLLAGLLAVFNRHITNQNRTAAPDDIQPPALGISARASETPPDAQAEIRGAWIASVYNIDFPSKQGLTSAAQKSEMIGFLDSAKNFGLNTVIVQVRPTGDAFYPSNYFPWSKWLTGTEGKAPSPYYDPLEYMIQEAHARGLKLHAWVNPYRLTRGTKAAPQTDVALLWENHPARKNPGWTVPYADGCLYLNPGIPEARRLVLDGVMEIVNNYDVDGIHMDDYFYPYKVTVTDNKGKSSIAPFNDGDAYKKYGGGFSNIDDWRRNNVDLLIREMGQEIHRAKPDVLFGISPFAVWANKTSNKAGSDTDAGVETYYDHYADTRKWVKEEWIDYICPQIYWTIGYSKADFKKVADWWGEQVKGTNTKLVVGHAAYKVGDQSSDQWCEPGQLIDQLTYAGGIKGYGGSVFYGFSNLLKNTLGVADKLREYYGFEYQADLSLELPAQRDLIIASPKNNYQSTAGWSYILGSSDPAYPLTVNGKTVERTSDGHFGLYFSLKKGDNPFVFEHKGEKTTHTIKSTVSGTAYTLSRGSTGTATTTPALSKYGFKTGSFSPSNDTVRRSGDELTFSCWAPPGSTVRVTLAGITVTLKQQSGSTSSASTSLVPVEYSGAMKLPSKTGTKNTNLGKPTFKATRGNQSATYRSPNSVSVYPKDYFNYAQVTGDQIYLRTTPTGTTGNQWYYYPAAKGMTDYIYGEENGFYLLRFGGWISKSEVKTFPGKQLYINKVKKVELLQNEKNTQAVFEVLENVPYNVKVESDRVTFTPEKTKQVRAEEIFHW